MRIKLVTHTPNPEQLIATAAKLCYANPDSIEELMDKQTPDIVERFLDMIMKVGHTSILEHVNFTFAIEDVSRSLTHQLVRHRHGSYSQQSQRYVKLDQFEYIVPPAIENDEYLKKEYIKQMCSAQNTYDIITGKLKAKYILEDGIKEKEAEKKAIEDARYVFPNACCSKIVVTMNVSSLFNFLKHRCCDRAQWEIRELAWSMWKECMLVAPNLFKYAGPGCTREKCPEGSMSCGKRVTISYTPSKTTVYEDHLLVYTEFSATQDSKTLVSYYHQSKLNKDGSRIKKVIKTIPNIRGDINE